MTDIENEFAILEHKTRLLQAEIIMQGMVAENMQRVILGESMAYTESDFFRLIEEYGIHTNSCPCYRG